MIGVVIFTGLAAYDTQQIKNSYDARDEMGFAAKKQIMGALSLYLDFINMFQFLLAVMGQRE